MIDDYPLIDDILEPHREAWGPRYVGIRSHAYRMLNFIEYFAPAATPQEVDRSATVAALHDLPVFLTGDMNYLDKAADLAADYLDSHGNSQWKEEATLMIHNHHRFRAYTGPYQRTVEATRRADWIDVSLGRLRFGAPKSYVRELDAVFPIDSLIPWPAYKNIALYAARHPRRPFPFAKW
jgi:hypothetical protein